jgi:hypothetical protein
MTLGLAISAFVGAREISNQALKPRMPRIKPDGEKVMCGLGVKKPVFWSDCQENILDICVLDTRFDQCLQGFRSRKKPFPGKCTNLALYAKMAP